MEEQKKIHPVIWVAAVSVTVLSIAGVGAIMGIIPTAGSKTVEPPQALVTAPTQAAPVVATSAPPAAPVPPVAEAKPEPVAPVAEKPAEPPAPAHKAAEHKHAKHTEMAQASDKAAMPMPASAPPAPPPCYDCGVIENVRAIKVKGDGSGVGMVAGGVVGGLLGHQVGGGSGKDLATIAGAVAGGFAGNEIEKSQKSKTQYEVTVKMEDGSFKTITEKGSPPWSMGQQVRVVNGVIQSR